MYVRTSGSAVFSDGSLSAISSVDIDNAAYLSLDSTFTITLTAATYLGTDGNYQQLLSFISFVCKYTNCLVE